MKTIHQVKVAVTDARNLGTLSIALFFLPLVILSFYSCTSGTESEEGIIINIEEGLGNVRLASLSEFADSVLYIPLETKPGMELDYIFRYSSKDTLIFANDGITCILFSSTGNILQKIASKGRGPGEYNTPGHLGITSSNTLLVQNLFKLMEFDYQGGLQQNYIFFYDTIGSTIPGNWILLNDSLLFVHVRNDTGDERHKAMIKNLNGRIVSRFLNHIFFNPQRIGSLSQSGISSLDSYSGKIGFKEAFNDTLFYLGKDLILNPGYVFNMGKYKTSYMDLLNRTAFEREYAYTQDVFETDRFFFLTLRGLCNAFRRATPIVEVVTGMGGQVIEREIWYYKGALLMVVDKTTGKSFLNDISRSEESIFKSGFINDLDGGPRFLPRFRLDENRLVMPVEAYELKQYIKSDEFSESSVLYPEKKKALEELANSLTESDNPVLMVVRMK